MKTKFIVLATVVVFGAALAVPNRQDPPAEKDHYTLMWEVRDAMGLARTEENAKAAAMLKAMEGRKMDEDERAEWARLARVVALRMGDTVRLTELRKYPDQYDPIPGDPVTTAYKHLLSGEIAEAKQLLRRLRQNSGLNARDERRVYEMNARIARIEGNIATERLNIERIVEHLAFWPAAGCQACHGPMRGNPNYSSLDVRNLWITERYIEILRDSGDAQAMRDQAAEELARDPKSDSARLRLAYATAALGDREKADQIFLELPWADAPDRNLAKPRDMGVFP